MTADRAQAWHPTAAMASVPQWSLVNMGTDGYRRTRGQGCTETECPLHVVSLSLRHKRFRNRKRSCYTSQGARISDLVSVKPGPVLPVLWLRGREKGHARRDRSPGPRTLKEGRGSQRDSADNRRASVALPSPLLWSAPGTRHQAPSGGWPCATSPHPLRKV